MRALKALGIDGAVAYTFLARAINVVGSTGTVLLIVRFLSPVEQGYYYTLLSLVSLQVVFEMGFSFVVQQLAAHECVHLELHTDGSVAGDAVAHARLASTLQLSLRWYTVAAAVMGLVLAPLGTAFFALHAAAGAAQVAWRGPWLLAVAASVAGLWSMPFYSFLEGCGQVRAVAGMRLRQAVAAMALAWLAMLFGHGLYSPALVIAGQTGAGLVFLGAHRRLLAGLLKHPAGSAAIRWTHEVWPFQWRIAVSWMCSYFTVQVFIPIVFALRGAVEAGQMGMSLSITGYMTVLALAWTSPKATPFGHMIARRQFQGLDRLFLRTLGQSLAVFAIIALGAGGAHGFAATARSADGGGRRQLRGAGPGHAVALLQARTLSCAVAGGGLAYAGAGCADGAPMGQCRRRDQLPGGNRIRRASRRFADLCAGAPRVPGSEKGIARHCNRGRGDRPGDRCTGSRAMNAHAPAAVPCAPACWQAAEAGKSSRTEWLLAFVLAAVFFTPTFRLPGDIPVRLEDFIVFSSGAMLALKFFFSLRIPRPDALSVYLTVLIGSILLSTLIAPAQLDVPMAAKDYLDMLRPLKFLIVYWLVREQDCGVSLHTFLKTVSVFIGILLGVAVLEMTLARMSVGGPVMAFFVQFCDQLTVEDPVSIMAQRPFATFNTPTHLGYVAALGFFLSQAMESAARRRILALLSFFTLLISVTRTLLFSLPLLMMLQVLTKEGSAK